MQEFEIKCRRYFNLVLIFCNFAVQNEKSYDYERGHTMGAAVFELSESVEAFGTSCEHCFEGGEWR